MGSSEHPPVTPTPGAVCRLSALKACGGFDAKSVSHGDWTWIAEADRFGCGCQEVPAFLMLSANYNYRNVPLMLVTDDLEDGPSTAYMRTTKPYVPIQVACAPFKTQKLLAGRAIVSDSFSAPDHIYAPYEECFPGNGLYAHREGYNVLYGDWSAKWYGDPQQRIMWYKILTTGMVNVNACRYVAPRANNAITRWWENSDGTGDGINVYGGMDIWHVFDTAAGIDVDAD